MERYILNRSSEQIFRQCFQIGGDMDGYIYAQEGEGIGSFLGNLFKKVIPLATKAIKGAARIAAPHIKNAAKDIANQAGKRIIAKLSPDEEDKQPSRKRKRKN